MDTTRDEANARAREIVATVRELELCTNRAVEELWAGQYRSVFRGRGMDFDEVRQYAPGDEVRTIDWKVTARMGEPFVKKFTEERELTVMLLVDVSASGNFGALRSKRETMAEVAGALAMSAMRCGDKVGLMLFTDDVELYLPPAKGRGHVLRILREVMFFEPRSQRTDIGVALDFLGRVAPRRAITLMLSDFCLPDPERSLEAVKPTLRAAAARHDLIACAVNDAWDLELPDVGVLTIEDAETGEQVEIDTGRPAVRDAYARRARRGREALRRAVRAAGGDLIELATHRPFVPELARFFETRKRRMAS